MPLRSVMMKRFIFGFQRRVWCPKWTPLSSSWRMVTTAMVFLLCGARRRVPDLRRRPHRREPGVFSVLPPAGAGRPDACARPDPAMCRDRGSTPTGGRSQEMELRRGLRACEVSPGGLLSPRLATTRAPANRGPATAGRSRPPSVHRHRPGARLHSPVAGRPDVAGRTAHAGSMRSTPARLLVLLLVLAARRARRRRPRPATTRSASGRCGPSPRSSRGFDPPARPCGAGHRGVDLRGGRASRCTRRCRARSLRRPLAGRGVVVVDHGAPARPTSRSTRHGRVGDAGRPGGRIGRLELVGSHCFPRACLHWGWIARRDLPRPAAPGRRRPGAAAPALARRPGRRRPGAGCRPPPAGRAAARR